MTVYKESYTTRVDRRSSPEVSTSTDQVVIERRGRIVTLTLNRPDKRNALTPEMLGSLAGALTGLWDDPDVRCIVLRGTGEHAFSSGFDIGHIGLDGLLPGENDPPMRDPHKWPKDAITLCPHPIIAMIHGYCVGVGLELAVACDLRIAADTARLGITPAKLGIAYGRDPIREFVKLIGPAFTKELFITGRLVNAQRAYGMGLVTKECVSKWTRQAAM